MRLKEAFLALATLLLPGCGERGPNLSWIMSGRVEVVPEEREALALLFESVPDTSIGLQISDGGVLRSSGPIVEVEAGRVVGLRLREEVDVETLNRFGGLKHLTLQRSRIRDLAGLGPWPDLRELRFEFSALESLLGLGKCCPGLGKLSIFHGTVKDLAPLDGVPGLKQLHLGHVDLVDLDSAPPLPALTSLHLDALPLRSLSGLERFEALENLLLFGNKELDRIEGVSSLPRLREIRLFQNALISLADLHDLPRLERLEVSDNRLLSLRLSDLPALRELEVHEKEMISVEIGPLPSLEQIDLRGEGSLFEGGRLDELRIATQPKLEQIDLRRNHLQGLDGLDPQVQLWEVKLDRNPISRLDRFSRDDFPALRHVSVHRTLVEAIPESLTSSGIVISHDPAEIEANAWTEVLRRGFESIEDVFVETLPGGGGSIREQSARCTLLTGTFLTPRLSCTLSMRQVSGLVHIFLARVDPLSPASGGPNTFPVRATIRTRQGRARVYLKYRLDIRGQAEALASYRDPDQPWIVFGEQRDPESLKKGYVFAEARPGKPGTISGQAHLLVDRLMVWVQGDDAEGVELVLE